MCVNYKPTPKSMITALTGADTSATPDWPEETWQDYAAPAVRAGLDGEPELIVATYGMMPRRKPGRTADLHHECARRDHRRETQLRRSVAPGPDLPAAHAVVL
jgi:hypothetical protein